MNKAIEIGVHYAPYGDYILTLLAGLVKRRFGTFNSSKTKDSGLSGENVGNKHANSHTGCHKEGSVGGLRVGEPTRQRRYTSRQGGRNSKNKEKQFFNPC